MFYAVIDFNFVIRYAISSCAQLHTQLGTTKKLSDKHASNRRFFIPVKLLMISVYVQPAQVRTHPKSGLSDSGRKSMSAYINVVSDSMKSRAGSGAGGLLLWTYRKW